MRIQPYQRRVVEPDTAGGVLRQGAGTPEEGAARGLGALHDGMAELAQRSQDAKRTTDVALRTLQLRQGYSQWFQQRAQDPMGYETLDTDAEKALTKLGEGALKGITDPLAQAAITKEVMEFSGEQILVARKTKFTQQVDVSQGVIEQQLWARRQEMSSAAPEDRERLMQQTRNMLLGAASAGYISPLDAEKKLRTFADGVVEDELALRVYQEPEAVLEEMASGAYNSLSVDSRQRLTINAERRAEALREQAAVEERRTESTNERKHTRVQELNFGTYYAYVRRGEVGGPALYEALQNNEIDSGQFRTLYDAAEVIAQAGGKGNPELETTLTQSAYRGELTVGEILQATEGPDKLNRDEANRLLALHEKGGVAVRGHAYKQAASFVSSSLGVIPGDKYGFGKRTNAVAGLALQELYQRVVTDPNADPQALALDIVSRYQGKGAMTTELDDAPQSRFPNLDAAKEALRNDDISLQEFNIEAEIYRNKGRTTP